MGVSLVLVAAAVTTAWPPNAPPTARVRGGPSPLPTLNLNAMSDAGSLAGDVVDGMARAARLGHNVSGWMAATNRSIKFAKNLEENMMAKVKAKLGVHSHAANLSAADLEEVVDDASMTLSGGLCAVDEEMHASLCYKKCGLLTEGRYPVRTSAFSCCERKPCGLFNQRVSLKVCGGFDVSGDAHSNGCPHSRGSCADNEETHLGLCYKKCSILTSLDFPFRRGAATCCAKPSIVGCLNPANHQTSTDFIIGGGYDGGDPRVSRWPHFPVAAGGEPASASPGGLPGS